MIRRNPLFLPRIQRVLHLLRNRRTIPLPTARGPIALALAALKLLNWHWSAPWTISTPSTKFSLLETDLALWAQELRQATCCRRLQSAADRRPDLQGCTLPLELEATNSAWTHNLGGPYLSGAIRSRSSREQSGQQTDATVPASLGVTVNPREQPIQLSMITIMVDGEKGLTKGTKHLNAEWGSQHHAAPQPFCRGRTLSRTGTVAGGRMPPCSAPCRFSVENLRYSAINQENWYITIYKL